MALASGLSQAALLAVAGACVALACGSETIELLPARESERAGASSGGAHAGRDGTGGHAASDVGGTTAQAGSGAETSGGKSGGAAGSLNCSGGACGGGNDTGGTDNRGGSPNGCLFGGCQECFNDNQCPDWLRHCSKSFGNVCVECDDEFGCRADERCNLSIGRCAKRCEHDGDCFELVCDPTLKACVPCTGDQQCLSDQNENTRRCVFGYCFECTESTDCPKGPRQICANWRCVECASDDDCGFDQQCQAGDCQ